MQHWYNILPLIFLMASTYVLMTDNRWTRILAGFIGLYFGIFLLQIQYVPFGLAMAKLITGVMAAVILYVSRNEIKLDGQDKNPSIRIFKLTVLLFFWVVSFITAGGMTTLVPLNYETICGAVIIITAALIQLGMNNQPIKITFGILYLYAGFDLVYGSVESSILVNGLLAFTTLLVAFVGMYITTSQNEEDLQ